MARPHASQPLGDTGAGAARRRAPTAGRKRWPRVLVWLLGVAVAAVLVERWTRPVEQPLPQEPEQLVAAGPPMELAPDSPASAAEATEQLIAAGRSLADQLAEAFPDDPQALTAAGQLHFALGNATKAVQWWERSTTLDPQLGEAWCGLATVRWEQGDFEPAVNCMQRVLATNPQLADERIYVLVDSLMNLGRPTEATAILASRAQTSALSPAGRIILGQAYLQAEDYDNARQQFAAAVAAAPRLANAHYGLANALTGLGQTELALKHREAYAQLKQEEYAALDHRRGAGREIEKVDPAEVRGVVAEFCLRAGKRYAHHGRLKEAETHWLQALRLDPRNPVPRELLESLAAGRRPAAP